MADHHDPRYRGQDAAYRQDGYADVGSGTPAPNANDPLAELARLIGNDSFNANRHAAPPAPTQPEWPEQGAVPHDAYRDAGYDYSQPDQQNAYADHYAQQNFSEPATHQSGETHPGYAHDPNVSYDQNYAMQPPAHQPNFAPSPAYDEQAATQYADAYHPAAQSSPVGAPPEFLGRRSGFPAPGYAPDAQSQNASYDEYYDDRAPRRRRAVLMAGAAAALVVVGTAGAFGYRALFGSSSSGPPPVIKADASPTKIVAAAPRDVSANKSSDRIGDQLNERVVSREEQPGDARPQPRVVFPGPTANGNPAQAGGANASVAGEPKRVRTVAIRPDQPGEVESAVAPRAVSPAPAPAARAASVPAAVPAVQPAPRQVVPSPPAGSNGPLSLSPDAGGSSAAVAPPARVAARPAPQAAAPAAAAAPGAYVQVSSQRSEGDAQASYRALQAKYPAVLGSRTASIQRADLGEKGTYYRAMVGPLDGPSAVDLCTNLKAAGGSCVIQKN